MTARRWPDAGELLFSSILGLLLFSRPMYLFSDGSTGWHLVVGRWVLAHRAVPRHEFLSYTFAGEPWVAFEWLSDVALAVLDSLGGLPLVAVGCAVAIATLFWMLYRDMRSSGCAAWLALLLCAAGAIASSVHWLARPHLVTFLATYVLYRTLDRHWHGRLGRGRLAFLVGLIFFVWANAHPAFPLGLVLLAIFLAGALLSAAVQRTGAERARGVALACGVAIAATFANPYGYALHVYVARHLADPVLGATEEFLPPSLDGGLQTTCFFALVALLVAVLLMRPRTIATPQALAALALAALALHGVRHVPLFVVVALPVLGERLASERTLRPASAPVPAPLACIVLSLGLLAVALVGPLREQLLARCGFDPASFPTATLEWVRERRMPEHGLAWDNWGGFLAYQLGIPIFIDDRSDFFPRDFTRDYARMASGDSHATAMLDQYAVEWVLFPREEALARRLAGENGWRLAGEDPAARLFVRTKSRDPVAGSTQDLKEVAVVVAPENSPIRSGHGA
jgi:hypothetical protein